MKYPFKHFIKIVLVGLILSSCNFSKIIKTELDSISLSTTKSSFVVGDVFNDQILLSIKGKYNNSTSRAFSLNEVNTTFTHNGQKVELNAPFVSAGDYKLSVKKDGIKSNTLTIKVFDTTQYVSSIAVNGNTDLTNSGEVSYLTLDVNPTNFTSEIECSVEDTSIVDLNMINQTKFKIKASGIGSTLVTFKAKSSETEYVETSKLITVNSLHKTTIEQTYNDYIKNNVVNYSSCPTKGNPNLLVIPVWFTDSDKFIATTNKDLVREDIYNVYFGNESLTGWNSVSTYYQKESRNSLHLNGTVSEWYESGISSLMAGAYSADFTAELVKSAVNWYFNNHEDSRSNYDYDYDGYLDGVMLIYAAADYVSAKLEENNLWAYCYWVGENNLKDVTNPGPNVFFWASYDFMYGSNIATKRSGRSYHGGDTNNCKLDSHTYIHEMGHVLGLEDYYDYSNSTKPAGAFSMQDYNIGGHDAFSALALGWANPYIPTSTTTIQIEEFQYSHDLILLTPNWNSYNSAFDEYLLLELYSPNELNQFDTAYQYNGHYPEGPSSVGIRLWHVDARLYRKLNNSWINNVFVGSVHTGLNNTTNVNPGDDRVCYAGLQYQRYNLLQLIRKDKSKSYLNNSVISDGDLFKSGNSFTVDSYSSQFQNGLKLDDNLSLGWSFKVNSIKNKSGVNVATITVTKI